MEVKVGGGRAVLLEFAACSGLEEHAEECVEARDEIEGEAGRIAFKVHHMLKNR